MPLEPTVFSTKECAWAQVKMKMLGRTITGLRGFEFRKAVEKELLYAAGPEAIDIQEGNKAGSGTITLLKFELDLLNDAAIAAGFADIVEVPHVLISITGQFKKNIGSKSRIIEVPALAFTDMSVAMQQNAKFAEVSLPFISAKVIFR